MKPILKFLIEAGKLKGKKRRGWKLHQIKNPETTAEHIFHLCLLVWTMGEKKKIDTGRAIKIALVHDLCEVYAPDLTPYDPLLPKNRKKIKEILKKWPQFSQQMKKEKEKGKKQVESAALEKLVVGLPVGLKEKIKTLWLDYEQGLTKEGRFVKQADKLVNFLQGMIYWQKGDEIQYNLWMRWIREIIDDPVLLELLKNIEENFFSA
ncbi:MAG: hypothetical protein COT34_02450 [Candidatus Nealsonbacteria bacterium CG08_land_8_20_14_0_20_43_11]|uniref:5'-deoxynucleotidase n=1 Tax=Candidatus Nealsonbacteria bacterium CG08_land_8_20_14_0_20_43_11 TaxID=1974706 RepID=A0A2M6T0A5_9BACT|nr:MAG: hypothetical protein COT34_02450 [Candidatus Nealsonbacteria bacterium CG08_land_8_20_14_0_20_43_11]